jgi:hypothetical protein
MQEGIDKNLARNIKARNFFWENDGGVIKDSPSCFLFRHYTQSINLLCTKPATYLPNKFQKAMGIQLRHKDRDFFLSTVGFYRFVKTLRSDYLSEIFRYYKLFGNGFSITAHVLLESIGYGILSLK